MGASFTPAKPFRIAVAQLPITRNVHKNAERVRQAVTEAATGNARLIQFPEGMLSGYAKETVQDWSEVDWRAVRKELRSIMDLAAKLNIWVVLGSSHPLTPPHWPHNSLYIISNEGRLINRYDKRIVSHTELTTFYTPGTEAVVFEVDGYRFGCVICIEINFPRIFMEYAELGVDCVLCSAYPVDAIFEVKARAHAAIYNYWISLATPTETTSFISSEVIGPDGEVVNKTDTDQGVVLADLDRDDPKFDIPLNKAKPWRASVATDPNYQTKSVNDPRSVSRVCL